MSGAQGKVHRSRCSTIEPGRHFHDETNAGRCGTGPKASGNDPAG